MKLHPWYIASASIVVAILCIVQFYIIYSDNMSISRLLRQEDYVREKIAVNEILSPNDRYLKVSKFYSAIITTYGVKYHPEKGAGVSQGLSHYQKADVILETYRLCELLDIPFMLPFAIATFESSFRPYVETEYETGMYQHRVEAVGQAMLYYSQMPDEYKRRCSFVYASREDLKDPINATRIELVLLWGLKRQFGNNLAYYVSAAHWGLQRIVPFYSRGIEIPGDFTFNKGTVDEDCRNPLMYFFIINSYLTAYDRFILDVWVETGGYAEAYRKACSRLEFGYLEGWKYAQDLLKTAKEVEINNAEYKAENERLIAKYNEKIKAVDEEYRRIHGLMKEGKFRDVKDLYALARQSFKEFRDDVLQARLGLYRAIITLASGAAVLMNLILLALLSWRYFRRKREEV